MGFGRGAGSGNKSPAGFLPEKKRCSARGRRRFPLQKERCSLEKGGSGETAGRYARQRLVSRIPCVCRGADSSLAALRRNGRGKRLAPDRRNGWKSGRDGYPGLGHMECRRRWREKVWGTGGVGLRKTGKNLGCGWAFGRGWMSGRGMDGAWGVLSWLAFGSIVMEGGGNCKREGAGDMGLWKVYKLEVRNLVKVRKICILQLSVIKCKN